MSQTDRDILRYISNEQIPQEEDSIALIVEYLKNVPNRQGHSKMH